MIGNGVSAERPLAMANLPPTEVFDQIVAFQQARTSSAPLRTRPCGLCRLKMSAESTLVQPKRILRRLADVDPDVRRYLRGLVLGELPWPLFLYGPAGVGKTCAALCLLDHAGGEYLTAAGLAAQLIEAQQGRLSWSHEGRSGSLWPETLWGRWQRAPLMVLDELGARERVSDHHYEAVQRMLDERLDSPLVCISNLDGEGIARVYDDRILSRLAAGTVVHFQGKDRRIG